MKKHLLKIYSTLDRFFSVLIAVLAIPQVIFYGTTFGLYDRSTLDESFVILVAVVSVILSIPLLFSIDRIVTTYNDKLRADFFEGTEKITLKSKINFLLRKKSFWIKAVIFACFYIILPLKWSFGGIAKLISFENSIAEKALALSIMLPIFFVQHIRANLFAMKTWQGNKSKIYKYGSKPYIKDIVIMVITYILFGYTLTIVLPFLISFLFVSKALMTLKIFIILLSLIFAIWLIKTLRAVLKRNAFIKRLKIICKSNIYSLSEVNFPYSSLFKFKKGESFNITVEGKEYSCKFISSKRKSIPLIINDNGTCQFVYELRFLGNKLLNYIKTYDLEYGTENAKILIINPIPNYVFTIRDGKNHPLDNGDVVCKYKVYTATAFLNALERNCLHR